MQLKEGSEPPAARTPVASRRSNVPAFIVMDVMEAAAAKEAHMRAHREAREAQGEKLVDNLHDKVIHMEVGQPGTPAPRTALAAAASALSSHTLGYTAALGMPALRERIARHYQERYALTIAPQRVVVTTGSSAGFVLAFLALFDAGCTVGLPSPGYPCYRHILTALGQTTQLIETGPEGRWMPTAAQLDSAARRDAIAGLVLASPANPTGTMLEGGRLAEIAAVCRRHGIWLVADEIYHGLTYGMAEATALAHSDDAVVINSFSKYFSMTGWRIGWLIVPERLIRPIERLAQNFYISPPAVAQIAAIGAFDGREELEANRRVYAENRALLTAELPKAGLAQIVPADGAFYLYVDISATGTDSVAFTRAMLDEIGIAATPGVDFDGARGGNYVRFCYAGTRADMAEAARRLKAWRRPGHRA